MQEFEGYVGVRLWEGQLINDLLFLLLLGLLILFSVVFRKNYRLFGKMLRDVAHVRDRLSIFEDASGNEKAFRRFMVFQSLFLCSLFMFLWGRNMDYINYSDLEHNLNIITLIFGILLLFYLFKQALYVVVGVVFITAEQFRQWRIGYSAAIGLWGALLYVPVLWMSFIGTQERTPFIMFVALFILCRLIIIYKSLRIFNLNRIGVLYIFLYLCALETLPLFFLYEGIKYLYNFIDELALWH
ncbi:MAG: DUF4271 domain-containing protein [Tannerellaceae bacterium]|jgi:hypothetical protein|nr:DUF4271 domain-containing protein [Tannerellaceae bacterium]